MDQHLEFLNHLFYTASYAEFEQYRDYLATEIGYEPESLKDTNGN